MSNIYESNNPNIKLLILDSFSNKCRNLKREIVNFIIGINKTNVGENPKIKKT